MITLTETCPRERRAGRRIGERAGRHKARLPEHAAYARLFQGEATSQIFRRRSFAVNVALGPSLNPLSAT